MTAEREKLSELPMGATTATFTTSGIYQGRLFVVDVPRDAVGPNRLYFCSKPFGQQQRTLRIALIPQGMKQFIALDGEQACSARLAEAKQQQLHTVAKSKVATP